MWEETSLIDSAKKWKELREEVQQIHRTPKGHQDGGHTDNASHEMHATHNLSFISTVACQTCVVPRA